MASLNNAERECSTVTVPPGKFHDPVFKKLAQINGEVNKMSKGELQDRLKIHGLDTRGLKDVLKKRLKHYYKKQKLSDLPSAKKSAKKYDYFMVIDFEATCEKNQRDYCHEIIEFPVVVIDVEEQKIVDEFHSYVRPTKNPVLSLFCTTLTGITQEQVARAPVFPDVLRDVERWLRQRYTGRRARFAVLSDGPWDMCRFMRMQCDLLQIPVPSWARKWVNIRKTYSNFYKTRRCGLNDMLEQIGLTFEGQMHSGIDDSRNIARIAMRLLADGCDVRINERLYTGSERTRAPSERGAGDKTPDHMVEVEAGDNDVTDTLADTMAELTVSSDNSGSGPDDVDDLLAYYALQKA